MSRQGKNTLNTTKSNMTIKTSGRITAGAEQSNIDKVEENDLKNNIRRMFEAFQKEMKISLKEIEAKTYKKLEEINKFLKENQGKAIKQVNEMIQDL